jgi:hypothetical protein
VPFESGAEWLANIAGRHAPRDAATHLLPSLSLKELRFLYDIGLDWTHITLTHTVVVCMYAVDELRNEENRKEDVTMMFLLPFSRHAMRSALITCGRERAAVIR